MKLYRNRLHWAASTENPVHPRQDGTAVIVLLFLLAMMLVYITANMRTLYSLGRELKLLDQRQTRRLEISSRTNSFAIATNLSLTLNPSQP